MTSNEQSKSHGVGGRILAKLLMPLVATTVSAAATYAAKKAPELIEEKVLPKLREARDGSGSLKEVPAKARSAAGGAGDLAAGLTDRVRAVAGGEGGDSDETSRPGSQASTQDRERRRRERAEHREARRKNSRS